MDEIQQIEIYLENLHIAKQLLDKARAESGIDEIEQTISDLEKTIKEAVLMAEQPVKGEHLQAIINKGRITWDSKLLEGYAVAHPEIKAARKEGSPTVTIRKV